MQSHCLTESGRVILYGNVFEGDVVGLNLQGVGTEGTHGLVCFGAEDVGVVIVGDDGLLGILATYLYVLYPRWDNKFFLVSAVLYVDNLVVVHKSPTNLDGFINGAELAGAIAGNDNGIGVIVTFAGFTRFTSHTRRTSHTRNK